MPSTSTTSEDRPTIVLVHGSFADASGFHEVIQQLQADGYRTMAPANPLRGLASDAAYVRSVLEGVDGPIVLVAHSYGGMVITNAATGNPNVRALVYINGFAPVEGETVNDLAYKFPGSMLVPENLTVRSYPVTRTANPCRRSSRRPPPRSGSSRRAAGARMGTNSVSWNVNGFAR